ncbi:hypothetical protein SEA_GALACTICA_27 [Streptomyces phage Galactica]|nr:hypothetical protein SEA_GALACTICA_27 [Streptomyces phage Galactica]
MVWFLGRKRKEHKPDRGSGGVSIAKSPGVQEAQRAVKESAARHRSIADQRGVVERVVSSLAEVRKENHFSEKVRYAMGGGTNDISDGG